MTMNTSEPEIRKALPARVCLFQILCAIDAAPSAVEIGAENSLRELFVVSDVESKSKSNENGLDINSAAELMPELELRQIDPETFDFCCASAMLLRSNLERIDSLISAHTTGWSLERMSLIDRTIIRLAVYEALIAHTVPVAVAISEAVLLAKEFGGESSPKFVNGVLGRIVRAAESK